MADHAATQPSVTISDHNYTIAKLHGHDDYQVWCIQMEDMYKDCEVWDIVSGTTAHPAAAAAAQTTWDQKNLMVLGTLWQHVNMALMIHVARATSVANAWSVLQNQYQSLGVAAMTMLHNKFTSLCMNEGNCQAARSS